MPGPAASSADVQRRMVRQQRRDTKPELALRRALHAMGLRYRVEQHVLAGSRRRADIVFGPARVAVFVDGCFWHSCPEHATSPKANAEWWSAKLQRNRERDADTDEQLRQLGWLPVRVWEHEDPVAAAERVRDLVLQRRARPASTEPPAREPSGAARSRGQGRQALPVLPDQAGQGPAGQEPAKPAAQRRRRRS